MTAADDGFSGTNFDRPGITRLIDDAKDGKVNLILVKDLSRFGRNYIQVGQFTDYLFPMIGCRFIALNDGVDTIHNDNDIMPFRNLFNEFQSRDTSKKIKAVKKACASNGMYLGCYAPYGYKKSPDDKHKFIIDETAAVIVRKIFALRCQGYGYYKIAGFLNEEKIPTPRDYYYQQIGKPNPYYSNHVWNDVTMKTIIRNEVYIGNMVQNKTGSLSYKNSKQIVKPKEDWIRVKGTHEPIIDMATWDLCVELDRRNNKKPRTTGEGNLTLFSGLVQCLDCGFKMRSNREKKVYPKAGLVVYTSYMCGNYARSGKGACSAHIIYEKQLVELLIDDICRYAKRVLEDEGATRRELIEKRNGETEQQQKADKAQIKSLESRLSELDRLIQKLYEDRVLSGVSETVFQELMKKYEAERADKSKTLVLLKEKLTTAAKDEQDIDRFMQIIRKYIAVEALDREMLLELIDHIEIGERFIKGDQKYRDITIHYNFVGKIN